MIAIRNLFGIIIAVLFIFNTWICDYFYDYGVNGREWLILRYRIYESMIIMGCFVGFSINNGFSKIVFSSALILTCFSFIDKLVFHISSFKVFVGYYSIAIALIAYNGVKYYDRFLRRV